VDQKRHEPCGCDDEIEDDNCPTNPHRFEHDGHGHGGVGRAGLRGGQHTYWGLREGHTRKRRAHTYTGARARPKEEIRARLEKASFVSFSGHF
jgi:hypothetical protein